MKVAFTLSVAWLRSVSFTNHVADCAACLVAAETHRLPSGRMDGDDDWLPLDTDAAWCPEGARRLALVAADVGEVETEAQKKASVSYVRSVMGADVSEGDALHALMMAHWSVDRAIKILRREKRGR